MEGEACQNIIFVLSGQVKVLKTSEAGREQVLEVLSLGDTCACNSKGHSFNCATSAQAVTETRIGFLRREYFKDLVDSNSNLSRILNDIFAERLCRFVSLIENVSLDNPEKRLVKFLLQMSGSSCSLSQGDRVVRFTHEEIAQRIGLVRETVTRHLQKLKKSNLIDLKLQQIVILDKLALEKRLC